jgi:DNA modification methylase
MKNKYIPIEAKSHTAPYKVHKYFARRPWNVFSQIISNYSSKNDIILDPFCGGGVTVLEAIKLNRRVIGCDLNPLQLFEPEAINWKDFPSGV